MDRKNLLLYAFQQGKSLQLKNVLYREWIKKFIVDETKGDIGSGDITSESVLPKNRALHAVVTVRENCIIAGVEESLFLYNQNNIKATAKVKDGMYVTKGTIIFSLEGKEKDLLKIERSSLDIMQRMSGIATLTRKIRKKAGKIAIAPTRKTQWRYLDKKAVYVGGGLTHRLALWDAILIKDNHLLALKREGITDAIRESLQRAWKKRKKSRFIEIEVQTLEEAMQAARAIVSFENETFPFLIMLDNMSPLTIKKAIKELKKFKLYDSVLIEVSGGITPQNIHRYCIEGVDVISLGYLTHSAKAIDIKQYIL